mmetsp:Transcript_7784/g.14474  ORF Transcript_7784/g.14474 Transcript_7784/m.14474 type:complete len:215 (-) Transcript_7784:2367-3011(-)
MNSSASDVLFKISLFENVCGADSSRIQQLLDQHQKRSEKRQPSHYKHSDPHKCVLSSYPGVLGENQRLSSFEGLDDEARSHLESESGPLLQIFVDACVFLHESRQCRRPHPYHKPLVLDAILFANYARIGLVETLIPILADSRVSGWIFESIFLIDVPGYVIFVQGDACRLDESERVVEEGVGVQSTWKKFIIRVGYRVVRSASGRVRRGGCSI